MWSSLELVVGDGDGDDDGAGETMVKNRFLGFLIWQSVESTVVFLLFKVLFLSPFISNPTLTPCLSGILAFLVFQISLLVFSTSIVASPQPYPPASPSQLALSLIRLLFVSGGGPQLQPLPHQHDDFRRRAKISLAFLLFVTASALSGFLAVVSVCWNHRFMETIGFRGFAFGFFYGLYHLYKRHWVLQFPIIQRPPFFSYKMGIPLAIGQALKLSSAAYLFSAVLAISISNQSKSRVTMRNFFVEQIIFYAGSFTVILCWELSRHLHQVLHTKRFIFAPPKGSAAAEMNPSEPLLTVLEQSTPRSLLQHLAYLDLLMVGESNVDTWRRAAFFEETGETYKRVVALCLRPLKQFTSKLGEGLDCYSVDKSSQLAHQLRSPTDSRLYSRIEEAFYDFQLCAWCARIAGSLTVHSHKEDRFGVAQLSGSNAAVITTLLSCLLAVETLMGKKTNLQSPGHMMGSAGIKWVTFNTGRGEAAVGVTGKRKGNPQYSKAYAMADIVRTSIYYIVATFHDEMLNSAKAGLLDKDWILTSKPLYGTHDLLSQKLRLFLDFRAT